MTNDVYQPGTAALFGLLVAFEDWNNRHICCGAVFEGVLGSVGFTALTQGSHAFGFASNGAGQHRAFVGYCYRELWIIGREPRVTRKL